MEIQLNHCKEVVGLAVQASPHSDAGFELPGYTLIKPLGRGSQGNVFLARRLSDGKAVAVKRLNIESVKTWKSYELFHREAEVLKQLQIDGIAKFYDAFDRTDDEPPCAYIIQEYIPGETLADLIKAGHRLSINRVYDIMIQMLKILRQLHEHTPPIVHRDIKPSNIILQPLEGDNFKVRLIDFGAVSNPQLQGGGSTVAGTYGFMPPEQLMGKPCPESDIYALAAVAVNLITGVFPADMPVKDFRLIFEPQMQFMPHAVVEVLRRMLDPKVENRLSDFDTLIHTFGQFRLGNYDISNVKTDLKADYENQLKSVTSYAQPGNIELWQQLPDAREPNLLACYRELMHPKMFDNRLDFGKDSSVYKYYYSLKKEEMDKKLKVHQKGDNRFGIGDTLYTVLIFILCGFWLRFVSMISSVAGAVFYFLLLFPLVLLPLLVLFLIKHYISKKTAIRFNFNDLANDGDPDSREAFNSILMHSQKTIATIVDIDYLNVMDSQCEHDGLMLQFSVHQKPVFIVKYRFNPPDDGDPNDLLHEIVIHSEPESFLKVGDPLPILYRIEKDGVFEHVYSMPFPLVLSDVDQVQDVVGHSRRRL